MKKLCLTSRVIIAVNLTVFLAGLCGCTKSEPSIVVVAGKVLIDNEPLSTGIIRFVPNVGRASTSRIQEDGSFQLSCYGKSDGAVVGKHRVEVIANQMIGQDKIYWLVPVKYARYSTSDIEYEVLEDDEDVEIELTWDGGKPFFTKQ